VLVGVFYSALTLAWVLGNPVGSAPDEEAHYLKALAVSAGHLAGERVALPPPPPGRKEAWIRRTTRALDVPAGLSPDGLQCSAGHPDQSAACQDGVHPPNAVTRELSTVGTAQPTVYLAPGLFSRLANEPVTAMQLARLTSAALCLGLIWTAIALIWDRSWGVASMVGVVTALTPTTVFLISSLTASGPEVAASVCFFAALLRVTRRSAPPAWTWVALGVSGVVLVTSRSLGPLWMALDLSVAAAFLGFRQTWLLLRSAGRPALGALSVVALGAALSVGWELTVQPRGSVDPGALGAALLPSLRDLRRVLAEVIGVFGSLDSPMPAFAYVLWLVMLGALVLTALGMGRRRDRVVLVALGAALIPLTLAVAVLNLAETGFGMQGRYVLPVVVTLPLLAGDVLARRRRGAGGPFPQRLPALLFGVVGGLQAVAWYANARRAALGTDGTWLFMGTSEWSPSTGWYPLAVLVVVAVVAFVVCGIRAGTTAQRTDATAAT